MYTPHLSTSSHHEEKKTWCSSTKTSPRAAPTRPASTSPRTHHQQQHSVTRPPREELAYPFLGFRSLEPPSPSIWREPRRPRTASSSRHPSERRAEGSQQEGGVDRRLFMKAACSPRGRQRSSSTSSPSDVQSTVRVCKSYFLADLVAKEGIDPHTLRIILEVVPQAMPAEGAPMAVTDGAPVASTSAAATATLKTPPPRPQFRHHHQHRVEHHHHLEPPSPPKSVERPRSRSVSEGGNSDCSPVAMGPLLDSPPMSGADEPHIVAAAASILAEVRERYHL